ncbi:hypothetical protein BDV40DRAFT_147040 [Aspergillus tamarii]|uniref:Uncharacterized protein n=1 Tax=Aspergillus tamarii TaxID=41984 RepID=A0A5N6UWK6_ASPTM|nr:hypothetical protein BDV40DRAFT_147040 [Aspergillus tamarii]
MHHYETRLDMVYEGIFMHTCFSWVAFNISVPFVLKRLVLSEYYLRLVCLALGTIYWDLLPTVTVLRQILHTNPMPFNCGRIFKLYYSSILSFLSFLSLSLPFLSSSDLP